MVVDVERPGHTLSTAEGQSADSLIRAGLATMAAMPIAIVAGPKMAGISKLIMC